MPDVAVVLVDLCIVALLVGAAAAWNRAIFVVDRSSFSCRLGLIGANRTPYQRPRWSRLKTRAKWSDDVLAVQVGALWSRTLRIRVRLPLDARIQPEPGRTVRRLGVNPQSILISQDDTRVVVAVRRADRTRLVGPFLAVAVAGLPTAPRPERRRKL